MGKSALIAQRWLRDNSLSLLFLVLFLGSLAGQSVSGWLADDERLSEYHRPRLSYAQYLRTGGFLDGIFVNWQAAMLQLGCLIYFGGVLRQKGASHSRKPQGEKRDPDRQRKDAAARRPWIYRHSLSLAFAGLFAASLAGHVLFGARLENETRQLNGSPPIGLGDYLASGRFWFATTQTWQAEFVAIFVMLVASIFLREQRSAESKPVDSDNAETGGTNE